MDGDIWYASEVNNFATISQQLSRASLATADFTRVKWDTEFIVTTTNITEVNGLVYQDSTNTYANKWLRIIGDATIQTRLFGAKGTVTDAFWSDGMDVYTVYDECNDSSVDATKWTSSLAGGGTLTENGSRMRLEGANGATNYVQTQGSGSNKFDTNERIVAYCLFQVDHDNVNGNTNSATLAFTDGTNFQTIHQLAISATTINGTEDAVLVEVVNDTVGKMLHWWKNDVYGGFLDWSSWSALRLRGTVVINQAVGSHMDFCFVGTEKSAPSSTITKTLTADGTNYESITSSPLKRFTNTGVVLGYKAAITKSATDIIILKDKLILGKIS